MSIVQGTISMKISKELKERLRALAAQRGVSVSALVKEGIRAVLGEQSAGAGPTCHDLVAPYLAAPDRIGSSGLGDLATDKRHLAGFGRRQPPAP
jgi:hypothetical protein